MGGQEAKLPTATSATKTQNPGRPALAVALGANCALFALWRLARRGGSVHRALNGHALCSFAYLRGGRVHTMFTSALSHQAWPHFFINSYGLFVFGSAAAETL